MVDKKLAIVDLGSNTFHLMIVKPDVEKGFTVIEKERIFTGLSDGGGKTIKKDKLEGGLEACRHFKTLIDRHEITDIRVMGTAVLRSAVNRSEFITPCEAIFDVQIEIIEGLREAELIYKGVSLAADLVDAIIMDIGGGSVEFIICKHGVPVWLKSYNIGLGVLYEFQSSDPISQADMNTVNDFLTSSLPDLVNAIQTHQPRTLIGASGTFEVIEDMEEKPKRGLITMLTVDEVLKMVDLVIAAGSEERRSIKGIPEQRVKLIVVAMIIIKKLIEYVQPEALWVSPYALKEGIVSEWLNQKSV